MPIEPHAEDAGFVLRRPVPQDTAALLDYEVRNEERLAAFSPRRPPSFLTERFWVERIEVGNRKFENDQGTHLCVFDPKGHVVGHVNLMNTVRGAFQCCDLGYNIDSEHEGTGRMRWAVARTLDYAFGPLNLHRIQANHLPDNQRSARLLRRLGFRREGYATRFLLIDGRWQDHVLNALTHDAWRPPPSESYLISPS